MSFSNNGNQANEASLISPGKAAALNPHAAEFVPFSLRPPSGATIPAEVTVNSSSSGDIGKTGLERSLSSVSINSDEEARQFWSSQLPDDITPDFNVTGDESSGLVNLSLGGLSLHEGPESSRYNGAGGGYLVNQQQELLPRLSNGNSFDEKLKYSVSTFGEGPSSGSFLNSQAKPWDMHTLNTNPLAGLTREGIPYNGNSKHGYRNNMLTERTVEKSGIAPLDFLAAQFPGFAAESLADVFLTNRCDLNQTIEMLSQLELQVDGGGMYPNLSMKTLSAPNLRAMDFPALSMQEGQNGRQKYAGDDLQAAANPYQPLNDNMRMFRSNSSMSSRHTIDHASAAKNLAPQDSSIWKFDMNGSADPSIGSSRSSHVLASSYNGGHGRPVFGGTLHNRGSTRAAPWLQTGEAAGNMYAELREEVHDHPRIRNAYFEQARQAYLIGNRAIAKELSIKGQVYDMHMKATHEQTQDAIFRQRNPLSPEMQSNGRGRDRERVIDLRGLPLNEAILRLKNELPILRTASRATDGRIQVYICVGTGQHYHHTGGTRAPARLPIGVKQYLLEEGLDFTEIQPGILRVVIY